MLPDADYFIRVVPFPRGVPCNGMVTPNEDGTYSVYLNAGATHEQRDRAYRHELRHIENDDFYSDKPISEIEEI